MKMALLGNIAILLALVTISVQGSFFQSSRTHKDVGLNIYQLAEVHGYPLEVHQIVTEDGYILTVHRIPHGKTNADETDKPVILMMHGILASSTDWINSGPGKSLAYELAEQGYDVWMGNARGNYFSRNHTTLNPDTDRKAFWEFSWHEIGYFDIPATIDFALKKTGQKELHYFGFSQGTTTLLVTASSRPEYNKKMKSITLMAPVGQMGHVKNPAIKLAAPFEQFLYTIGKAIGLYEILPKSEFVEKLTLALCDDGKITQELCKLVVFSVAGYDREQLVGGFIPVITTNYPAGSSLKQFMHFLQVVTGPFRRFDYHNDLKNIEYYGSPEAPEYDLGLITSPVAIYYGMNDWLSSDTDAKAIASQIPNVVHLKEVEYSAWTHFDFIWGKDAMDILYKEVITKINLFR